MVCGLGGVFLANVFLPHIPAAILAGGYSPGVLTAALVNLPFFPILFRQGVLEGRLTARQAFASALIGAASLPLCIAGALALSGFCWASWANDAKVDSGQRRSSLIARSMPASVSGYMRSEKSWRIIWTDGWNSQCLSGMGFSHTALS